MQTVQPRKKGFNQSVLDYFDGVRSEDLRRLFARDATRAYRVLTRDHAEAEPTGRVARFFHRAKVLFLGMSAKLTPARRLLFVLALLFAFLGQAKFSAVIDEANVRVDFSPMWYLLAIATLVFLLALELVDRVLVRDELEVARELQRDLLPKAMPAVPGFAFAHSYRTANEVGGDYYDVRVMADGRVAVVIGDASGHGMAAGLLMATAHAALNLAVEIDPRPELVATLVNRVLCRTGDRHAFMSLFFAVLDPATGALDYVCAGHPFPLHRRPSGASTELGTGGLPLGIRESVELVTGSARLEPGDTLLLYSDGLPEAIDRAGREFGFERLRTLLTPGGEPAALHARVVAALEAHLAGEPPQDDVSVLVVHRQAA